MFEVARKWLRAVSLASSHLLLKTLLAHTNPASEKLAHQVTYVAYLFVNMINWARLFKTNDVDS